MQGLVKVYKNNTSGNLICNTTSSSLTTIRGLHTFLCTTSTAVTFTASDRFFLWVGINLSTAQAALA